MILLSGYHTLLEEHYYWSTQPNSGVPVVHSAISRNRYLHFADNQSLTEKDKMSKMPPLYIILNCNLVQLGIFHELLSDVAILWTPQC